MKSKVIIGAGPHAGEVYCLAQDLGHADDIIGFAVDEPAAGQVFMGKPVLKIADLPGFSQENANRPELIIAIGDVGINARLSKLFRDKGFSFFNLIAPSLKFDRHRRIGNGVLIGEGCILTNNISIGDNSIINIACSISHDCTIGNNVNLSPGCHLAGKVTIEDEVFVGVGASFIPKVVVGKGSIVAAGACVTKDVPPYSMVAGVPAVVKKQLKQGA
jgi:acetyltransferase EpsM